MQSKKILFGVLAVAAIAAPSCGGASTHEPSSTLRCYHADLNHDGRIADFTLDGATVHEDNLTWAESFDTLLAEANSMAELSAIADVMNISPDEINRTSLARYEVLHEAEELLMQTQAFLPLYNYADPYLLKPSITEGPYTTALGFKFFDKMKDNAGTKEFSVCLGTKAESLDPGYNTDSSTANIISNMMVGVNKWDRNLETGDAEITPGGGVANYTKYLITDDQTPPEGYKNIDDCDDLKDLPAAEKAKYIGTARYYIEVYHEADDTACWSDGEPVKAFDLTYAWDRSSSNMYNGTVLGMWASLFDCIRGYNAWNAIGPQTTDDVSKWNESTQEAWNGLTETERNEWKEAYNAKTKYNTENCKTFGGLAGVMLDDTSNNTKFVVQLVNDCDYFDQLLCFPAFFPVPTHKVITERKDGCASAERESWAFSPDTFPTTGPFKFTKINNIETGEMIAEKNEHARPSFLSDDMVTKVTFRLLDDDSTMYSFYKSGTLQMIDSVSSGIIDQVKKTPDWKVADQMGLYYAIFNVNDNTFDVNADTDEATRQTYRKILNLLVNRYDIAENVVKSGATPANGVISTGIIERCIPVWDSEATPVEGHESENGAWVAKTMIDPETNEEVLVSADWHERNGNAYEHLKKGDNYEYTEYRLGHRDEGKVPLGFYPVAMTKEDERRVQEENINKAIDLGKTVGLEWQGDLENGHFAWFPQITVLTNSGTGHESIFERMQAYYSLFNINLSIETQEWNAFLAARRKGAFSLARNGWIADYSDPRTYLDISRSTDTNNDSQLGRESTHRSH